MDPYALRMFAEPYNPTGPDRINEGPYGVLRPRPTARAWDPLTPEELTLAAWAVLGAAAKLDLDDDDDAIAASNKGRAIARACGLSPAKLVLLAAVGRVPMCEGSEPAAELINVGVVSVALVLAALEHYEFIAAHPDATETISALVANLNVQGLEAVEGDWGTTVECAEAIAVIWLSLEEPAPAD